MMNGFSGLWYFNVAWLLLLCSTTTKISSISLSDNGSTLSFVSAQFIKKLKLPIMGTWRGNLQTLNDVKNVSTSFYKLVFNTSNGDHSVLYLETSNLGCYYGVLCVNSKPMDILLGLDAAALSLDKLFLLNGRKIGPPVWAPNVFLYGSPASDKFSLVGRMNVHYPVKNNEDKNKASGIFYFADEANLVACNPLLESGHYTHPIHTGHTATPTRR